MGRLHSLILLVPTPQSHQDGSFGDPGPPDREDGFSAWKGKVPLVSFLQVLISLHPGPPTPSQVSLTLLPCQGAAGCSS